MIALRCHACRGMFEAARKDRRWCTQECKQELKRRYDRERYPEIAAEVIERACGWQRANSARKSAYDAAHREANKARIAERKKAHALRNPPAKAAGVLKAARRRARKLANGSYRVSERDLRRLYARHEARCAYCRTRIAWQKTEWDHIIPIARGGSHGIGNLAPACRECNRSKAWKFLTEWRVGRIVSQCGLREG